MARTRNQSRGNDPLFQVLHRDHEEIAELFRQLVTGPDQDDLVDLWSQLSLSLTAHTRAENDAVYQPLAQLRDLGQLIARSIEEHNRVDEMLADADAFVPGTDEFFAVVSNLEEAVRKHVEEEETEVLPRAAQALDDQRRDEIVREFQRRKLEIRPEVEQELEAVFEEERLEVEEGVGLEEGLDDERPEIQRPVRSGRKVAPQPAARTSKGTGSDDPESGK